MNCAKRKHQQLILFFLSGVFLFTLYQLTISTILYDPLPLTQVGEDFGSTEGVKEATVQTRGLEDLSLQHMNQRCMSYNIWIQLQILKHPPPLNLHNHLWPLSLHRRHPHQLQLLLGKSHIWRASTLQISSVLKSPDEAWWSPHYNVA